MCEGNVPNGVQWYAVYTKGRHEKALAKHLSSIGVSHFLPLIARRRKWSDRYKILEEPLFPSYLFVNVLWGDHVDIMRSPAFVRFVGFNGRPCPVPDEEIGAVRIALEHYATCDPYPYLKEGMKVMVLRGPLKGYHGLLAKKNKKHKHRLVLSINLIGRSVAVEVNGDDVEPL